MTENTATKRAALLIAALSAFLTPFMSLYLGIFASLARGKVG
jgi:hypothetical protein